MTRKTGTEKVLNMSIVKVGVTSDTSGIEVCPRVNLAGRGRSRGGKGEDRGKR